MEEILNKFRDENGFIKDIYGLYKELIKYIEKKDALNLLKNIIEYNKSIISEVKKINADLSKLIMSRKDDFEIVEYVKVDKPIHKRVENPKIDNKDILFYINYIEEHLDDNNYLNILPKNNDKDSMRILFKILNYYKSKIEFVKSILSIEHNPKDIEYLENELVILLPIYEKILEYKDSIKNVLEEEKINFKNKVSYFINKCTPYIYLDIKDSPEIYDSIMKLINSIEIGTFKNIKSFAGQFKGLFEVRDISNGTRVIFEINDYGEYCIIGAILSKAETNSIYKERLMNRYKTYIANKENTKCFEDKNILKLLLRGDNNE